MEPKMITFTGRVSRQFFHAQDDSGFRILAVRPEGQVQSSPGVSDMSDPDEALAEGEEAGNVEMRIPAKLLRDRCVTVVGALPTVRIGMRVTFTGKITQHRKFGWQVQVVDHEVLSTSKEGLVQFLRAFEGIGAVRACKIFDAFGEDSMQVIRDRPEALVDIVGEDLAYDLAEVVQDHWNKVKVCAGLAQAGFTPGAAERIYKEFKGEALDLVRTNPYAFTEVYGISFRLIDGLFGTRFPPDFGGRLQYGLIHVLREAGGISGHTFLSARDLIVKTAETLGGDHQRIQSTLVSNVVKAEADPPLNWGLRIGDTKSGSMVVDFTHGESASTARVYSLLHYVGERGTGFHIRRLSQAEPLQQAALLLDDGADIPEDASNRPVVYVNDVEESLWPDDPSKHLDPLQVEALRMVTESPFSIITGGPGTGKSSVTKALLQLLPKGGTLQCAPTGRAAKRMEGLSGYRATTIHRALEWAPFSRLPGCPFLKNALNPLLISSVLVDEVSMLDVELANHLLSAIPDGTRVVLIGDKDQLPSVGPGSILSDLLSVDTIPSVELRTVFRQKPGGIVDNAHRVNSGIDLEPDGTEVIFIQVDDVESIPYYVVPQYIQLRKEFEEVQVMSPTRKGAAGVDALNLALQAAINPPAPDKEELHHRGRVFRPGDRVMHIKNNRDLGAFNGDIGTVFEVGPKPDQKPGGTMEVAYGASMKHYTWPDINELVLGYASTVHKCQGGEFPAAIIVMHESMYRSLRERRLLYTALTRAKERVVLVGQRSAFTEAIRNNHSADRNTALVELLQIPLADGELESYQKTVDEYRSQVARSTRGKK